MMSFENILLCCCHVGRRQLFSAPVDGDFQKRLRFRGTFFLLWLLFDSTATPRTIRAHLFARRCGRLLRPAACESFFISFFLCNGIRAGVQASFIRTVLALGSIAVSYPHITSQAEIVVTPVSLAALLVFLGASLLLQLVRLFHNRVQSRELGHNALTTQLLNLDSMSGGAVPRQIHCHMSPRTHNNPTPPLSHAPLSPCPPTRRPTRRIFFLRILHSCPDSPAPKTASRAPEAA